MPDPWDDHQTADGREDGENSDRDEHGQRSFALAVIHVTRVCGPGFSRLASEDRVVEAKRVGTREERPDEPGDVERPAERPAGGEHGGEDPVLRPEACEGRDADQREDTDEERDVSSRHRAFQPSHPADVLLPAEVVDHDAGRHEEQRLEEGVRHQVEDRVAVGADSRGHEHVADLRHRRVGDHALDVPLHERDETGNEKSDRAQDGREMLDVGSRLEDRMSSHEQIDAGRDHRRRVDERGHRGRALHRVRKPCVERDLRGLGDCSAEQSERDEVHGRRRHRAGVLEDAEELERPRLPDEQHACQGERGVTDRVHHKRLLGGGHGFRSLVPEPDQEVRREADETPADEEQQEVAGLDEQQHREDEERHVREVPTLLVVAGHVAHRVPDDQPADAGDDEHHHARERVEEDLEADLEVTCGEPGVRGRDLFAVSRVGCPEPEEGDDGAAESDECRERRDPTGHASRDALPRERDRDCAGERREQTDPGASDHQDH